MSQAAIRQRKYRKENPEREALAQFNYRKKRPEKYLYNLAKRRCLYRPNGYEFSIKVEDVVIPEVCPLLQIKLDILSPNVDVHPSIDRIDSKKGYIPGNVMVISHRANRIKSDANAKELAMIASNLAQIEALL